MQARSSIVVWAAAASVFFQALASFYHRHFSPAWDFARGHSFIHTYDAVFTYLPILMLGFVAWGSQRRRPFFAAYGFLWVIVLLVAPPLIAQRIDPTAPVVASCLRSFPLLASVVLSLSSFLVFVSESLRAKRAAG